MTKSIKNSRLVLGTAQLGLPYGIANKTGRPDQSTATVIVSEAWKNGIREFDTAQAYGESEVVLGYALAELNISNEAKIISKFAPNLDPLNTEVLAKSLDQSLKRLGVRQLYCFMLHREEMLSFWNLGLADILNSFVSSGKVERIGVSVYSPVKAIEALCREGINIVQIPTNILDRRFEDAGVFQLADKMKKMVYVRSVFLQGLLLMDTCQLPEKMSFAIPVIEKLESFSKEFGISRHEIAIGYIKSEIPNTHVIFGAETREQITENLAAWQKDVPTGLGEKIRMNFSNVSEQILNPHLW